MSREILDSVWSASGIRLIGDGVPAGDVMAAQASLTRWEEWFPYWTGLGDTYERLAREALARNRRQSAGELFWQACLSHHYAQFLWFHDPVRRDQGQMRKVALYREAAPLFAAPAIRFDLPFDGFVIPGYVRLPPAASGRVPVVIVLGGFYAIHSAAHDPRFRACVCWGVLFDLSYYDQMRDPARRGFAFVAGYDDAEKAGPYLKSTLDLSGQAERVRCPVYALHGAQDVLIPATQVERLRKAMATHPDMTFDIPQDGNHCCHNLYAVVRPRMADWLAERLSART